MQSSDVGVSPAPSDTRLTRAIRLRKSADFSEVQREGRRWNGRHVVFVFREQADARFRFGLAVSKKVGGAVVRNRVKRQLREWMRQTQNQFGGLDLVLIARSSSAEAGFDDFGEDVRAFVRRVKRS